MEIEKLTIKDAKAFDTHLKNLHNVSPNNYYNELVKNGYIILETTLNGKNWYETTFKADGYSFVSELEKHTLAKNENDTKIKEKEDLEIKLAKSNIEANTLNIKNTRKNMYFTWSNILIGVLNLVLLALQLLKD